MTEIETLDEFDRHVAAVGDLRSVALQGLDLCSRTSVLLDIDVRDAAFLGCIVEPDALRRLHRAGALFFPRFPDLPFSAFRGTLYDASELFGAYKVGQPATLDAALDTRVYRWYRESLDRHDVVDALAQRIHDHAIDDALEHVLDHDGEPRRVVAIMGGHSMQRDDPAYASVVRIAYALTNAGYLCASGGGPGAMEATNLGGWLACHPEPAIDEALELLAAAPAFEPVASWLDAAFGVRDAFPLPDGVVASLGIPTWHYGHEPPNVFASHIAKYFANAIREDGLLAIAQGGVIFAPGSAGTIQEIFQDAAQNHYESFGRASPMVFLDTEYWSTTKPVFPLLEKLAATHAYGAMLSIHDTAVDVVAAITAANDS